MILFEHILPSPSAKERAIAELERVAGTDTTIVMRTFVSLLVLLKDLKVDNIESFGLLHDNLAVHRECITMIRQI
jgi:hypothetical protein